MSARRQASTTSLSKFARVNSPELTNRNLDFCNAFWGLGDGGVDVLFARMRGAVRTMEELRTYWRERASIEEDYAKRMGKLAKMTLGRDEIGELRNSLDTLRLETDKQGSFHLQLAQQLRNDLEGQSSAFCAKQAHHKKNYQSAIEKAFKAKQTQESYVNKAREKYEADCLRINSYTAQSTLVQGKDLEKINLKLERAQLTVQANERDFANFARALGDTVKQWEADWKAFCDSCQDLEEERMEFVKDNMWAYANAVSTVCVNDDESCEKLRLSLEQLEPERDMENFVRDYGTGSNIPDPPAFVNYTDQNAVPSAAARPTARPAQFVRNTQRARSMMASLPGPQPEEEPAVNTAGVGAGGMGAPQGAGMGGPPQPQPYANGTTAGGSSYRPAQADPDAEPIGHNSETMLKIGNNAYKVDINQNDPQPQQGSSLNGRAPKPAANGRPGVGDESDPLARQMEQLRNAARIPPQRKGTMDSVASGSSALSPPSGGPMRNGASPSPRDYRNSAEVVVGAYPQAAQSRPASPNPPSAVMMQAPRGTSPGPEQDVVKSYGQSLPGERNSRRSSYVGHSPHPSQSSQVERGRPVSREGHAGIGANGRSRSPQPFQGVPISRSASPALAQQSTAGLSHRNSYIGPPANSAPQRATSPNQVGIALDPSGRVSMDAMADRHQQQQRAQQQQQQWNQPPPPPPQGQAQAATIGRRGSYQASPGGQPPYVGPPPPLGYGAPPGHQGQQAARQPTYMAPAQSHQYGPPQPAPYQPPPPPPQAQPQQPVYAPTPQMTGYGLQRGPSVAGGYYQGQQQQQQPPQQVGHQMQGSMQSAYGGYGGAPSPRRSPSPQPPAQNQPPPTGQYTEDGKPVLFYVKALYDYQATIEEEFDFQSGDIIAVTATPEDGWWSGELLDEQRRQPGRHVFPSNFVCLF